VGGTHPGGALLKNVLHNPVGLGESYTLHSQMIRRLGGRYSGYSHNPRTFMMESIAAPRPSALLNRYSDPKPLAEDPFGG
jgi:hypothetical protein